MPEQFDFNKLEDQEKFEKLSSEEKERLINKSHEEALKINELSRQKQEELEKVLSQGRIIDANKMISFIKENNIPLDLNTQEIINAYQQRLEKDLSEGWIIDANNIISFIKENNIPFDLNTQEIINASHKGLEKFLSEGRMGDAREMICFIKENNIPLNLNNQEIINACQKGLEKDLSEGSIGAADFTKEKNIPINLNTQEIINACQKGLEKDLSEGWIGAANKMISFIKENNIDLNTQEIINICQKRLEEVISEGRIDDANKIISFIKENNINLNKQFLELAQNKINFCKQFYLLEREETRAVLNSTISDLDFNLEGKNKKELAQLKDKITDILLEKVWPPEVKENFIILKNEIGLENAWKYLTDCNRHDALYFIPEMLMKIPNKNIIKNLLIQTAQDNSLTYEGLDSRQALALAIKNFEPGWFEEFSKNGYFDNVKTFRKEIEKKRKLTPEILAKLEKIKKENPQVYEYANKLINHPLVEIGAVIELLDDPERFFTRSDNHANVFLQENLNPQTLTEVNDGKYKIDLNAKELRNLLIEGALDQLSFFKPFSKEYSFLIFNKEAKSKNEEIDSIIQKAEKNDILDFIHNADNKEQTIADALKKSLNYFKLSELVDLESLKKYTQENINVLLSGKKIENLDALRNKISQEDISDKVLLEFWQELLKYKYIDADYLIDKRKVNLKEGTNLNLDNLKEDQKEKLKEVIMQALKNLKKQYVEGEIILKSEIIPHNDPRFATIGDDTHSCMPFGSGKHNVYMWNLGTGAFIISFRKAGEPEEDSRIAVQSVLTVNKNIGSVEKKEQLLNVFENRENDKISLNKVLGDNFLEHISSDNLVISCDNVEGHKNYIKMLLDNDDTIIEKIYRDFFEEYRKQNPYFKGSKVIIGKGYSDYLTNLEKVPNPYLPLNLISYSDNLDSITLELLKEDKNFKPQLKKGIQEISWPDVLSVAYLEDKVYQDNPELKEGLVDLQQVISASLIASIKNQVPNLNLGYFDEKGILKGYLLSYLSHEFDNQEKKIYVHDIAVDPEEQHGLVAFKIFHQFIEKIKNDSKLSNLKLAMRCRGKTSYELIKKLAPRINYKIILEEETENAGETMYYLELEKI